jgi:hypothetical protein
MKDRIELLAVWLLSFGTWVTMNNIVGVFAIIASITSIIRNLPYIKSSIKQFLETLKD